MEGAVSSAFLQVLFQNLFDISKNQISLIKGFEEAADKLTETFHTTQQFLLDAEMQPAPNQPAVRRWLKNLENMAFDADHLLDKINYHRLSNEIKNTINPDEKKKKVLSWFSSRKDYLRRRKMSRKIIKMNENMDSINKVATQLGLTVTYTLANTRTVPDLDSETNSFSLDPIFIGRDGVVSEIVDKILTPTQGERATSILTIVGMGGLGKTTLTRKVFNHEMIETQFGYRIWVHVSRNFDPNVLLKKILKELCPRGEGESSNKQDTMRKLSESLKEKTYLLVLDDVWNEDPLKWENFIHSLLGVTIIKGNAIVVTTRIANVGSIVNADCMHHLEGLSEEDCWSIIKEKVFGKGVNAPSEIESIGRRIVKRCQGLPLAASVVGGVLQRDKSEENWLSIDQKWLARDDGENITRILRLSFDSLSSASLKKCFAYCSMFPKGYKINKQELIEQWMAEGFLQLDDGNDDMESAGEKFINILLNNSLLQVANRNDRGNVESCLMHDLVHDVARSIGSDRAYGSSRVRYMVLKDELSSINRREMRYFRTLILNIHIYGRNDFSHFEGLHVLTLEGCGVVELPSSIKKLIHLRKLNISWTGISNLPEWIGELHYLQTLRAEMTSLKKLPSTVKYLINMRHLYLTKDTVLPAGIGRLTSLQTLRYFIVGDENGANIAELESLNNLKGELDICNLERVRDKEDAAKANLFQKSKIVKLCLHWDAYSEGEMKNEEDVLEGLQPPADLKKLEIHGFKGKRFPAWSMKMAVQNVPGGSWIGLNKLIDITLFGCYECEEIPMLGHLPNLKSLWLEGLRELKRIDSSVYGLAYRDTRVVFPALESLNLYKIPKLAEWAEVECEGASEVEVFPRLRSLKIRECKQLMSVPTHSSPCLEKLEIQSIEGSVRAATVFRIKYAMLTRLCLQGMNDLEYLPDWLFNENPNLSIVKIRDCPKLRELPPGLRTLTSSLKELIIEDCPCLERIPDDGEEQSQSQGISFSFTSLRRIDIRGCDALVSLPRELIEQLCLDVN